MDPWRRKGRCEGASSETVTIIRGAEDDTQSSICVRGSTAVDSTKGYVAADIRYVVRPMMVASVLNTDRLIPLSLFPKQYSLIIIYIPFTL